MSELKSPFPFPENAHRQEQYEALLACIAPGERVEYVEAIARLQERGVSTAGIGLTVSALAFRGTPDLWRNSEIVSYREPFFDHENEGNWTEGTLWVVRAEEARAE